jgi:glycosyltransferase involved in cell wall biosynthesis
LRRHRPDLLVSHTSPELTWLATRLAAVPYVQYHNSPPFYIGAHRNPYMASRRYRSAYPRIRSTVAGYDQFAGAAPITLERRIGVELRTALKHRALAGARAVIVPSLRTRDELRLLHGVEATVLRGCLRSARLDPPSAPAAAPVGPGGRRLVLSVCRLDPVKRLDLLLHAFARVRRDAPDASLVIAGTGPDEARLRAIATALDLDEHARFVGYVPDADLPAYFAAARVLAAPAMADFIIAPYEAMAAGCRVVWTTEMETDPEIENSGQVFVAEPRVDDFAAAIVHALNATDERRADLSGMTWDARGHRLEAILRAAARLPGSTVTGGGDPTMPAPGADVHTDVSHPADRMAA